MKIADLIRIETTNGGTTELRSDVERGPMLPRPEAIVPIDARRWLLVGWFRHPPFGLGVLLVEVPSAGGAPLFRDHLILEGSHAQLFVGPAPTRFAIASHDIDTMLIAGRGELDREALVGVTLGPAPPARRFHPCANDPSPRTSDFVEFEPPTVSCAPLEPKVAWIGIDSTGFILPRRAP